MSTFDWKDVSFVEPEAERQKELKSLWENKQEKADAYESARDAAGIRRQVYADDALKAGFADQPYLEAQLQSWSKGEAVSVPKSTWTVLERTRPEYVPLFQPRPFDQAATRSACATLRSGERWDRKLAELVTQLADDVEGGRKHAAALTGPLLRITYNNAQARGAEKYAQLRIILLKHIEANVELIRELNNGEHYEA